MQRELVEKLGEEFHLVAILEGRLAGRSDELLARDFGTDVNSFRADADALIRRHPEIARRYVDSAPAEE